MTSRRFSFLQQTTPVMSTFRCLVLVIVWSMTLANGSLTTEKTPNVSYEHSDDVTLKIGFLAPRIEQSSGVVLRAAFMLGLRSIQNLDLLPGRHLMFTYGGSQCNDRIGMKTTVEMWQESRDLDAIIGDDCSVVCQPVALLAAAWNIPEVAYSCVSNALSDKRTYPTFSRSSNVYNNAVPILVYIAEVFGWKRLAIITDFRDLFRSVAIETKNALEARGTHVTYHAVESSMNANDVIPEKIERVRQLLTKLKEQVRIFLIMMYTPDIRNILVLTQKLDMLDGRFAFFGLDAGLDSRMLNGLNPEMGLDIWQGWIRPLSLITLTNENVFKENLRHQIEHPEFRPAVIPSKSDIDAQAPKAGRVHDAVLTWAHGVNKTLTKGGYADDGLQVTSNIFNLTFQGITGDVYIDHAGNRLANFKVEIWQDGRFVRIMEWKAASRTLVKLHKKNSAGDWSGLLWAGNTTTAPADTPHCGWQGELCSDDKDKSNMAVIAIVVTSALVVLFLGGIFVTIRARNEAKLKIARSALIPWTELAGHLKEMKTISLSRATMSSWAGEGEGTDCSGHMTSRWNNQLVVIKSLGRGQISTTDRHLLKSLVIMKSLKHENIRGFLGLSVDGSDTVHVILDVASRGSVQDIIGSSMKLTWELKVSLIRDISFGILFLHNSEVGYGKSIIPITAVLASDIIDPGSDHMGIIVCPLIALVNDQVKRLKEGGIPAVGLHGSTSSADKQEITAGNTKIIIATPETLLSSRTLLQPLKGKVSLVCADEAHCISEMGLTFRPKYTELGKIFALFQCQILSMTATSTASVCHDILKSLGMITPHIIAHLPDRKDLCFEVASASHSYSQLDWIADELISMKEKSKKIIVFVKTIRESSEIYKFILNKQISSDSSFLKFLNPENRLIDFIHAKMAQSTIDRITNSFSKSDSELRVIISTSVLSMGVNFPDVDIVVLFGLPRSVSQLVQMSGRCARKSGLGLVVVYATKKSMQDITDEWMMKMIGKKDDGSVEVTECQRVSMMSAFCLGDARTAAELESLKVKVCGCKDSCGEICDCALCKCCSFCSMKCPCYRSDQNFIDVHVTNCRMA